ncbi:EamA family transporter [Elioraea rosea]|uniref:EamA family transporter n=1 Tax=Elioraea rosea TaxID=2492390 RepID=UPI0011826E00|nr:EamA family transporter [Elioraea rosea]
MTAQASPGVGIAAALAAALIWGGTLAAVRAGVAGASPLPPVDLALLRFVPPALLAPLLLRRAMLPPLLPGLALVIGGGAPFVLLVALGMAASPAAEAGVLLPGSFPLWVALLGRACVGAPVGAARFGGLALVAAALGSIALPSAGGGAPILLGASALAAGYTLALRQARLAPLAAVAFVSSISVALLLPALLAPGMSHLAEASAGTIATQLLLQGVLAGIAGPVLFATAIARLGAARAAAFGGLTPGAAALFGLVLLGEVPDAPVVIALALAGLGVAIASLARAPQPRPRSGRIATMPAAITTAAPVTVVTERLSPKSATP